MFIDLNKVSAFYDKHKKEFNTKELADLVILLIHDLDAESLKDTLMILYNTQWLDPIKHHIIENAHIKNEHLGYSCSFPDCKFGIEGLASKYYFKSIVDHLEGHIAQMRYNDRYILGKVYEKDK